MRTNEGLVKLEEGGGVSMFAKSTVEKAYEPPGFVTQVGHMGGDQDRSEWNCKPRYLTNETNVKGIPPTVMRGVGSLDTFFREMSIWQHLAGCRESKELLIQDTMAVTSL